jgi:hypothetical protein
MSNPDMDVNLSTHRCDCTHLLHCRIVDLVVVNKGPGAVLLCVRKKLLKQSETNVADPAVEVGGGGMRAVSAIPCHRVCEISVPLGKEKDEKAVTTGGEATGKLHRR